MQELSIITLKNELRTDSRLLASFLDHRHRNILENVDKYQSQIKALGSLPFQTEVGVRGGSPVRYALLNEDQCYFLLTLMRNNAHVVQAKLNLVKAFRDARAQLAERDIARLEGKQVRAIETQSIKELVDYASAQGSKSADRYYVAVTKMTSSLAGVEAGHRDRLDATKLQQLAVIETVVSLAIRDGIKAGMGYKDIYRLAKMRSESLVTALALN